MCFRAWYPSYYGKEVLGDISGASSKGNGNVGGADVNGNGREDGAKSASRRDREKSPMLDRLYVCPYCFKYSKVLVTWWEHVGACEQQGFIPGEKIYVHPKGTRTVQVPVSTPPKGPGKKKRDGSIKTREEVVQDQGEWSIWEVDGEKDTVSRDPFYANHRSRMTDTTAVVLPELVAVREAIPGQQICLLRC